MTVNVQQNRILLRFRRSLLERIQKVIMTLGENIRYGKTQYNINRKTVKISALSSIKISYR